MHCNLCTRYNNQLKMMATTAARSAIVNLILRTTNAGKATERRKLCTSRSSSSSRPSKRTTKPRLTVEQRAAAVKSYITEYMNTHHGEIPSCFSAIKEVGGSWNTFKKIYNSVVDEFKLSNNLNEGIDATSVKNFCYASLCKENSDGRINSVLQEQLEVGASEDELSTKPPMSDSALAEEMSFANLAGNSKSDDISSMDLSKLNQDVAAEIPVKKVCLPQLGNDGRVNVLNQSSVGELKKESMLVVAAAETQRQAQRDDHQSSPLSSTQSSGFIVSPAGARYSVTEGSTNKLARDVKSVSVLFANHSSSSQIPHTFGGVLSDKPSSPTFQNVSERDEVVLDMESISDSTSEGALTERSLEDLADMQAPATLESINYLKLPSKTATTQTDRKARSDLQNIFQLQSKVVANKSSGTRQRIQRYGQIKSKKGPVLFNFVSHSRIDDDDDDPDFSAFDYPDPEIKSHPLVSRKSLKVETEELKVSLKELQDKPNKSFSIILMFLEPAATENDISIAFSDCGRINTVQIIEPKREDIHYKYAFVHFKTEEGFQNALMKRNVTIRGADVVIEAACLCREHLSECKTNKTVKEKGLQLEKSRCKVMIRTFPSAMQPDALKKALSFCGNVANISMGPSNSTVYIEFETEEFKDRALRTPWISIDGKQVQMCAVDPPTTPVVRISNINPITADKTIFNFCESLGHVKRVNRRHNDVVDVYFTHSDLNCMPRILNSLNGVCMDQCRWQAQSAPIFPPETLQVLWKSSEGRAYLHDVIQKLIRVISKNPFDGEDVTHLASQFYDVN